jgi:hypothetical protein
MKTRIINNRDLSDRKYSDYNIESLTLDLQKKQVSKLANRWPHVKTSYLKNGVFQKIDLPKRDVKCGFPYSYNLIATQDTMFMLGKLKKKKKNHVVLLKI